MTVQYAERVSKTYYGLTLDDLVRILKRLENDDEQGMYGIEKIKIGRLTDEYGKFLGFYKVSITASVGGIHDDIDAIVKFVTECKEDIDEYTKDIV